MKKDTQWIRRVGQEVDTLYARQKRRPLVGLAILVALGSRLSDIGDDSQTLYKCLQRNFTRRHKRKISRQMVLFAGVPVAEKTKEGSP